MKRIKVIKSELEDQLQIDEQMVDEVVNADEFKDTDITPKDVLDAVAAIDALADAVIEKADAENKELDPDTLLDEVRDLIDETHEDTEVELEEEEILPEELTNSAVRVMVSEDGGVEVETKPDEVYASDVDGLECTMYDTCTLPPVDVEETGTPTEETEDDLLVIGNSKATNFKKGFVTLTSSSNKKAWSAAFKKVKKMIGNAKMTAAHWVIVSALAKKEEENDKLKKKIECALVKKIRSNSEIKSKLLKSSEDFADGSAPENETKPEAEVQNKSGYSEEGEPTNAKSPEHVDSQSGNPTKDPDKQNEREDDIVLPEGDVVTLDVPLTNSVRKVAMKKVYSSKRRGFNAYRILGASANLIKALDGKVVKSGKIAFAFKDTANGLLACAAKHVDSGKGAYTTVMSNNQVIIAKGEDCKIFNNVERFMNGQRAMSARKVVKSSLEEEIKKVLDEKGLKLNPDGDTPNLSAAVDYIEDNKDWYVGTDAKKAEKWVRDTMQNTDDLITASAKKPIKQSNKNRPSISEIRSRVEARMAKREALKSHFEARKAKIQSSKQVDELRKMHDAEERQRLFQSSQTVMNDEKIAIKQCTNRNAAALEAMYKNMF